MLRAMYTEYEAVSAYLLHNDGPNQGLRFEVHDLHVPILAASVDRIALCHHGQNSTTIKSELVLEFWTIWKTFPELRAQVRLDRNERSKSKPLKAYLDTFVSTSCSQSRNSIASACQECHAIDIAIMSWVDDIGSRNAEVERRGRLV